MQWRSTEKSLLTRTGPGSSFLVPALCTFTTIKLASCSFMQRSGSARFVLLMNSPLSGDSVLLTISSTCHKAQGEPSLVNIHPSCVFANSIPKQ
eukprot:1184087-Prorocentrum_minimum.AAC.3